MDLKKLESRLTSPGFLLAALLVMVGVFFYTQVEVKTEKRSEGEPADIAAIADRDDVNLIFILIDTLRADRLGVYGYERPTSPVMDYLAESGVRFANHHSQSSWTKTSMASLWTGVYPQQAGVLRAQHSLPQSARVPAEIFSDAGYKTVGIWRNGWIAPNFGFGQGFDAYHNPHSAPMPGGVKGHVRVGRINSSDLDVVVSVQEFLRTHHDERFFLYLHLMDIHQYVSDETTAIFGSEYSDSYDNAILWTDRQVGGVVAEVERLGLRDNTVVVIASDHGEAFGEHGTEGHARNLHAEVTTTPFIVSLPFRLSPGVVIDEHTANVDVFPTLLDLMGVDSMPDATGVSLLPVMQGTEQKSEERVQFAQLDRTWGQVSKDPNPTAAVTDGLHRLMRNVTNGSGDMLFDLRQDPLEQRDIAASQPELVSELAAELDRHLEERAVFEDVLQVELNDMELKQLRALGYDVR